MSEYVPIDIDDVVHKTDRAMLIRFHHEELFLNDGDYEPQRIEVDREEWIQLSDIESSSHDATGPCIINVTKLWAEREGLLDDHR